MFDLKGKTVIPGRKGGVPYMTLLYVLKQNGINPKEDLILDENGDVIEPEEKEKLKEEVLKETAVEEKKEEVKETKTSKAKSTTAKKPAAKKTKKAE